jgi:hypothetical protein
MPQFKAFSPDVEIWGGSLLAMVDGLASAGVPREEALVLLDRGGVQGLEREGWYSQQALLDALREAGERHGERVLRIAGRAIPEGSRFPPELECLERALLTLDIAYQVNHRGGRIGQYACRPLGPRRMEFLCDNPYGCELDQGILETLCARHAPAEAQPRLTHPPGTSCRKQGSRACVYHIEW